MQRAPIFLPRREKKKRDVGYDYGRRFKSDILGISRGAVACRSLDGKKREGYGENNWTIISSPPSTLNFINVQAYCFRTMGPELKINKLTCGWDIMKHMSFSRGCANLALYLPVAGSDSREKPAGAAVPVPVCVHRQN